MVECIEARLIVEANETQQLIRAHASFTLDENYKEDLMKEDEVLDDATQVFNNQSRVEDSFRANVISLEQICKRQDCQGMEEHEYEAVNDGMIEATSANAEYDALYTSKCKAASDNEEKKCKDPLKDNSEIEITEEKFEDNKVLGPDIKALWYMSLKVKLKVGEPYQYITRD